MVVRIQQRHDTSALWKQVNPPLLAGEMGVETDGHRKMKVGDGISKWNDLPYFDEEFIHTYGDEVISGLKQFLNNTTIGSDESLDTRANLFVHGDVFVDGIVEGVSRNAVCDEYGNNIFEYYQKKLASETNIIDESVDWNTIVDEGIYKVNAALWYIDTAYHQPVAFDDNLSKQGVLVNRAYDNGHIFQMYIPMMKHDFDTVMTVVYRTFIKDANVESDIGTWSEWGSFAQEDKTVVHIEGAETIVGRKIFNGITTFTEGVNIGQEGSDSIIQMNGENYIRKNTSGELYLAGSNGTIYLRPLGIESDDNEIKIDTNGVIDGKCIYDGSGNKIDEVYVKKTEIATNVLSTVLKNPELTEAQADVETYERILRNKYMSALTNDDIFEVVSTPKTLYAFECETENEETGEITLHTIYADSDTAPATLFDKYGVEYAGTDFTITEGVIKFGETECVYNAEQNIEYGIKIENGVATGFGLNNYIKLKQPVHLYNNFEISFEFTTPKEMPTIEVVTGQDEEGNDIIEEKMEKQLPIICGLTNQYIACAIDPSFYMEYNFGDGTKWTATSENVSRLGQTLIEPDTHYGIKLVRQGDIIYCMISVNNSDYELDCTLINKTQIPEFTLVLGTHRDLTHSAFISGSIDLNTLSVKVGRLEQISKFNTEMDVLKAPDYQVVNNGVQTLYAYTCDEVIDTVTGETVTHIIYADSDTAPEHLYNADKTIYIEEDYIIEDVEGVKTIKYNDIPMTLVEGTTLVINPNLYITEDGIASKFTNTNYVEKEYTLNDNWSIIVPIKVCNEELTPQGIATFNAEDGTPVFKILQKNGLLTVEGFGDIVVENDYQTPYIIEQAVFLNITKQGDMLTLSYSEDLDSWSDKVYNLEGYNMPTITKFILGSAGFDYNAFAGIIDLNMFKIYENDNLTYYPCLNIPYVSSNDGTKIVDLFYLNRLVDCYEIFNTCNYFILDEEGLQFRLPFDSLDGYCHILKHWRKGAESYEYDTNLECIQTGQATNGTAVVLKKPYADDNYYVSVACASKDRFGFTPSEDSIYYTKGRIYLE